MDLSLQDICRSFTVLFLEEELHQAHMFIIRNRDGILRKGNTPNNTSVLGSWEKAYTLKHWSLRLIAFHMLLNKTNLYTSVYVTKHIPLVRSIS